MGSISEDEFAAIVDRVLDNSNRFKRAAISGHTVTLTFTSNSGRIDQRLEIDFDLTGGDPVIHQNFHRSNQPFFFARDVRDGIVEALSD